MKKIAKICLSLMIVSTLGGCADWMGFGDNKTTTTAKTTTTTGTSAATTTAGTTTEITTTGTSK